MVRTLIAALVGGIIGAALTTALAQPRPALDPPQVAPHIFQVKFENDRVRALKVTERHGETRPLHSLSDRVVVYLSNCAWVTTTDDGQTRMDGYKVGDVVWREAVTDGGQTSNVIDACLSMEIELKDPVLD